MLKLRPETRKTNVFVNPQCPVYVVSGNFGQPTYVRKDCLHGFAVFLHAYSTMIRMLNRGFAHQHGVHTELRISRMTH